jgi:DnaJ family protein C protein 7
MYNAQIYCNRGAARMKLRQFAEAKEDCDAAIAADPKYVKAYVRRAECLMEIGTQPNVEQAIQDLHECKRLLGMDAAPSRGRHGRRRRTESTQGGEMGRKVESMLEDAAVALKMAKRKDYCKILGVTRSERDAKKLKKAYRKCALKWHPDRHAGETKAEQDAAATMFKECSEAYEVLSDPQKRAVYERGEDPFDTSAAHSHRHGRGGGGGMPADMFSSFFGGGGGGGFHFG